MNSILNLESLIAESEKIRNELALKIRKVRQAINDAEKFASNAYFALEELENLLETLNIERPLNDTIRN